jgi:hypothetical protein
MTHLNKTNEKRKWHRTVETKKKIVAINTKKKANKNREAFHRSKLYETRRGTTTL